MKPFAHTAKGTPLYPIRGGASGAQTFKPGTGSESDVSAQQQRARPFAQASQYGLQPALTYSIVPGAAATANGPTALPACGGYLRRILIEVVATGGTGGTFTAGGDAPVNLVNQVRLLEPNNTPIVDLTGYNLAVANIYGGYAGTPDYRTDPDYVATTPNVNFELSIPVEIDTTGRGALADLSSSSAFQLFLSVAATSAVWSAAPSPVPTLAVSTVQDYWTLPNPVDQDGIQQATSPPFPGTIQLWSQLPNVSISSGQRVQMTRMGNMLRLVAMVFRSANLRSETPAPNPLQLRWDDVILHNVDLQTLRKRMRELVNGLQTRDTGVYVLPYNQGISRFVGGNGISSYLPTVTATRYEVSGATGGSGTVDFVVNEVTSAPISGVQRSTTGGGLQYYPPAPPPGGPGVM